MSTYKSKSVKEMLSISRGQLIGRYSIAIPASLLANTLTLLLVSLGTGSPIEAPNMYVISLLIGIVTSLLSGVFVYGQARFYLNLVRGKEPLRVADIFFGFKNNIDKAILVEIPFTIIVLICEVPYELIALGYIPVSDNHYELIKLILFAAQSLIYFIAECFIGLSFYILCDHPEYSLGEILRESLRLMENKKGKYILTRLCLIPITIVGFLALGIGTFWIMALRETLNTNFYLNAIEEEPANAIANEPKETTNDSDYSTSETH